MLIWYEPNAKGANEPIPNGLEGSVKRGGPGVTPEGAAELAVNAIIQG
jgi:hypothetical protein